MERLDDALEQSASNEAKIRTVASGYIGLIKVTGLQQEMGALPLGAQGAKIAFVKETCRAASRMEENPYPGPSVSGILGIQGYLEWEFESFWGGKSLFSLFCKFPEIPGRAGPGRSGKFLRFLEEKYPEPI